MTRRYQRPTKPTIEFLERRLFRSASPVPDVVAHTTFVLAKQEELQHQGASPAGSVGPTGITPAQIRRAYGIDTINFQGTPGDGAGQTIAIVDAFDDPNAASDLHSFDAAFALPDPPSFTQLNEDGGVTLPGTDPAVKPNTWELEESLDIEWAHVIAPEANIILYEANSPSFGDLIVHAVNSARSNPAVKVVSMSFGVGEFAGETAFDGIFTTPPGHVPVTFLASTGDGGAPAAYPATSPNVVGVGGTTLSLDSAGNYFGETGWSGSGGGISLQEPAPAYQTSVQNSGQRTAPDVALDADPRTGVPVFDTFDNGASAPWIRVGGTSLATPLWAGLIAVADQGRGLNGLPALDGRSQTLPLLYGAAPSDFHDITIGDNGFSARPGYDLVTGLGSPVAGELITTLTDGLTPRAMPPINNVVTGVASVPNTITFRRDANGQLDDVWVDVPTSGAPTQLVDPSQPVTIKGGGLSDVLVFDASNGDPLPDAVTLNGNFSIGGPLAIGANHKVVVAQSISGGGGQLSIQVLTIEAAGDLEVDDAAVTVSYATTSPLAAIQGYLTSGRITSASLTPGETIADVDTGSAVQLSRRLIGDLNGDGIVDFSDLVILAQNFGQADKDWSRGDLNYDGIVGFADLVALAQNFGRGGALAHIRG